jgi:hypothetical protein
MAVAAPSKDCGVVQNTILIFGSSTGMANIEDRQHRTILQRIARRVMIERGLLPDFSVQAIAELNGIQWAAVRVEEET